MCMKSHDLYETKVTTSGAEIITLDTVTTDPVFQPAPVSPIFIILKVRNTEGTKESQ